MGLEAGSRNFLAPVGREAVHDEGIWRMGAELVVDLVALQLREAVGGFLFFSHADPDIGIEDIGPSGGSLEVGGHGDVASCAGKELGGGLEMFRCGNPELEPASDGRPDPRAGNVAVAIADEDDLEAGERTA